MSNKSAVYAGTFDPITNGHLDIVERALKVFPHVYVTVAGSSTKNTLFSLEERKNLIAESVAQFSDRVSVDTFDGLLVEYVKSVDASVIVRGLRAVSDYDYEAQMAISNRHLAPEIETVFLVTSDHCSYISSSIVRDIARNKGDVSNLVPPNVVKCLQQRFSS